jgi:hypothetical protein
MKNNITNPLTLIKKDFVILVFFTSLVLLFLHELYRLFLGCPRVLGDCYIDGADDYILIFFITNVLIRICIIVFFYRLIKKFYYYLKPKQE